MQLIRVFVPLLGAVVMACGSFSSSIYAQGTAPQVASPISSADKSVTVLIQPQLVPLQVPLQVKTEIGNRKSEHTVRVKNLSANLIAYWLAPANNPLPVQFSGGKAGFGSAYSTRGPQGAPSQPGIAQAANSAFPLPDGIDRVIAIEPQNTLLIFGTDAGFKKLQETITFLDRPLRQIEIEARFVQISEQDAKAFNIDFGPNQVRRVQLGFVRGNYEDTLKKLVVGGRAKILSAPRVTAINNLTASLSGATAPSVTLGFKDEKGKFHELGDPSAPNSAPNKASGLRLGTSFQFTVTPTINNDDTVTLLMAPNQVLQLIDETNTPLYTRNLGGLESIINVRDGDTIALTGLNSNLLATLESKKTATSDVLLLVTARIIRRAGDDEANAVDLPR